MFFGFDLLLIFMPLVLGCCWLGDRKGIRAVKTEWWGAGVVICLEHSADLHMAQWMPLLLTVSCFSKIQIGFTFLVPAHPGSPGQRAVKRVCVCVCVLLLIFMLLPPILWAAVDDLSARLCMLAWECL